ncbi:uncharacterized protein RHO25_004698 [Cercospora beticola]|uniref:Protein kinase domain-containing protein n=1 Tax=Cercospora beticola TaxID=122368 RepID=A0ABZ0NKR2_CERBT|nr:hypothetical protein RHO25_004698 [Cercospora beticola]
MVFKLWDLLEGNDLFPVVARDTDAYDESSHLAHITALLGPKPDHFPLGRRTALFYDADGCFKHQPLVPSNFAFETSISCMQGEDKKMFIDFVKRMIKWLPEERSPARELLQDPWLHPKLFNRSTGST